MCNVLSSSSTSLVGHCVQGHVDNRAPMLEASESSGYISCCLSDLWGVSSCPESPHDLSRGSEQQHYCWQSEGSKVVGALSPVQHCQQPLSILRLHNNSPPALASTSVQRHVQPHSWENEGGG